MKDVYKYLKDGTVEAFIPFEEGDTSTKCNKNIKAYCFHFGVRAEIETIYACNSEGEGFRFAHVKLDKPIERKKEWK